jgi:glycosyltransferase involved in cell wall biosynthesis
VTERGAVDAHPLSRRVCMFVYNNFASDARVLKEAATLTSAGYEVTVVAVLDKRTVPCEDRDGIRVVRINRDPLHYKVLRASRQVRRHGRLTNARIRRWTQRRLRKVRGVPASRPTGRSSSTPPSGSASASTDEGALRAGAMKLNQTVSAAAYRTVMRLHKPLLYLDWYYRAARYTKDQSFETFHAHDLNTLPVAAFLARRRGAHLVYDAHELYPEVSTLSPREAGIWGRVEAALIKRPDHIVTVGQSIADEFVRRYRVAPPCVLLNCPTGKQIAGAPDGHALRERAGLASDARPIVLYQGGFAPNRGLEQLLDAARDLRYATLVLMGWGLLEDELRERIAAANLEDRVRMIPPVEQKDLLAFTSGADVGVIPYRPVGLNNTFTTPNKLFEYIRAGVAIAASRLPELVRFVEKPGLGSTFNPDDPADIARVLNGLTESPERLAAIRERTVAARDRFVWERESQVLLDIYGSK